MTTVSGIIRDTQGNALPGLDVTIQYKRPLVGYNGGAAVQNARAFTTDGDGLLTMPDLVPGHYDFFVSIQANAASSVTLLQNGTLVVLTEGPMTLEAALDSTIGEITPTILQQAIAAAAAAEGFRDEAEAAADSINQETIDAVAGISADVTTVAGISADVTAVAGDEADIGIVAANIADVSTVAGISADVTTAAANVTDITNFADVYLGPSATDPTLRNDGSALQEGDLYFNTADDVMKVFDGSGFVAAFASLGDALLATNNLSDLTDASAALTNLGVSASAAELNILNGATLSTAELNFVDGVTSNIQTQINARLKSDDKATQAEAEAGTDNSVYMTPLRTAEAIDELSSELTEAQAEDDNSTVFGTVSGQRLRQSVESAVLDEDDFASNSATRPPSQQSAKAYVDAGPKIKAWVNFDGTGTVSISESFNVASVTDRGVGRFTLNFENPIGDDYGFSISCCGVDTGTTGNVFGFVDLQPLTYTNTELSLAFVNTAAEYKDTDITCVTIFR